MTGLPLSIAHRGASAVAPENTLAAVGLAIELGADAVEIDVQRSRDGALVALHDTTLTRTTNVRRIFPTRAPWRVADFTLDELRSLDAGSWKSSRYAGEPVPTLMEALQVIGESSASLLLELKEPGLYPGVVADLASTLGGAAAVPDLVVQSFDIAAMKELKTRLPQLQVGLLGTPQLVNLPALASWADQVNPHHWSVTSAYVDAVHRCGMQCFVWTVDAPSAMRRAVRLGVDGVITNRPDRFAAQLARASTGTREPAAIGGSGGSAVIGAPATG